MSRFDELPADVQQQVLSRLTTQLLDTVGPQVPRLDGSMTTLLECVEDDSEMGRIFALQTRPGGHVDPVTRRHVASLVLNKWFEWGVLHLDPAGLLVCQPNKLPAYWNFW